ncbi:acyltransferase family protein [Pseudomonas knackmussii]|uniref:acyltransferase family protein n=1 Tax=Pseudomonas knackmussii TaxID=65741 RepID=UPI003BC4717B
MSKPRKERFIGLEWLRFLLGLYVVIYHTLHAYPAEQKFRGLDELTSLGFFATSTFFVLSGFLLAHVYVTDGHLRESPRSFFTKRFSNLYPIHICSILLTIGVLWLISNLGIGPDLDQATPRFVVYDTHEQLGRIQPLLFHHWMSDRELMLNSILQLTMLHAWNPLYLTFNAPLWSLSTLFFFYLCFPFVGPRLMRVVNKPRTLLVIWVLYLLPPAVLLLNEAYGIPWTGLIHRNPLLRLPEFLCGILAYGLFREHKDAGRHLSPATVLALGGFVLANFLVADYLYTQGNQQWYYLLHNGLLLPSQLVLVYLSALAPDPRSWRLQHWSPRLGAASLSLFALHVPLFTLFSRGEKLIRAPGDCLADWAYCVTAATQQQLSLWLYPLFLLFMVVSCLLFQERLVVPLRKWLIRHLLPVQSPARPVTLP